MFKKIIAVITFFILTSLLLQSCATMDAGVVKPGYDFHQIKRVAVLDFNDTSYYKNAGPMVAQLFVKYLLKTGYNVVERTELDAILKEHNLYNTGALNREQMKEFGKISGVDAIITGSVTEAIQEKEVYEKAGYIRYLPAQAGVACRMISVETGEILWAASDVYDSINIQTAFEYLVASLVQDFMKILNRK